MHVFCFFFLLFFGTMKIQIHLTCRCSRLVLEPSKIPLKVSCRAHLKSCHWMEFQNWKLIEEGRGLLNEFLVTYFSEKRGQLLVLIFHLVIWRLIQYKILLRFLCEFFSAFLKSQTFDSKELVRFNIVRGHMRFNAPQAGSFQ